jgi:DNA-binding MarR family transcriptional regulator
MITPPPAHAAKKRVYTRFMQTECYCTSMRAATRRITAVYDAALKSAAVNAAQFALLRRLSATGPLSIQQLAVAVELERSTVARNVRVLEKSGLVTLATAAADRRTTMIGLSVGGIEVLEAAAPLWASAQRRIEERLGVDGAAALRTTIQTL